MRAFAHGVAPSPENTTGTACFDTLPEPVHFAMVAGVRFERVQMEMKPGGPFVVRRRSLGFAAKADWWFLRLLPSPISPK